MNRTSLFFVITLLITGTTATSCSAASPKYHPGGPYYYKSWADYFLPYRPIDEVTKSEAEKLESKGFSYYIAFFNEQGQITSFEKRYQGKMEFKVMYSYKNGLLKKEESLDSNGRIKTTWFNKNGERIKP